MIAFIRSFHFSIYFSLVFFLFFKKSCDAQDSVQVKYSGRLEKADVHFVSQWPDANSKKSAAKQSFINLLTGKKKPELKKPVSMVVNDDNSYWILDQKNNSVFEVRNNEAKIPHFTELKNYPYTSLVGICNFHKDEILYTDSYLNKIFLANTSKKSCRVLNDSLKLNQPTGIAYSKVNNEIWLVETGEHRLLVLNDKGELIKKIGSRGSAKGEFNFPTHIWIDDKGNVFVLDAMNFRIQVFDKDGKVISVFGSNGDATGYFASPKGIASDSYGHIYVADALFHVIQIFDINGVFLYSFGSQGREEGQFWMPSGIFIDKNNFIYISDSYNSRIQVFQLVAREKK